MKSRFLWTGFVKSTDAFPDHPAVYVAGETISYKQLRNRAQQFAATVQQHVPGSVPPLIAVFAYRSPTAFAGVLGSLLCGHGYVPLNRTFPVERTRLMLQLSGCRSVIIDNESALQIDQVLEGVHQPLLLLFPDLDDISGYAERWPNHIIIGARDLELPEKLQYPSVSVGDIAYLLFTSGSTGIPKGVMVNHQNVLAFIDYAVDYYGITKEDRFSQMFEMTFDLSVFDMFVAWEKGACVCCPPLKSLIKPGKFIKDMELTVWFSVPSTAVFMKRLGMLKPNSYPSLRYSLFCGEPLPVESARAWMQAAPNSIIDNLYGPTELTIACMSYRWDAERSPSQCELGVVPIGYPFPGMNVLVVDKNLDEVPAGSEGELLMNGPQMTPGYWENEEKTAESFIIPPGKGELFYRTGDNVRKPKDNGPFTYLSRVDFQIKIRGHRVELGEIEAVVREASGLDGVVALGWPMTPTGAEGIEVFLEGERVDKQLLRSKVAKRLPDYMIPRRFTFLDKMPFNVNGKYDRKALIKVLEKRDEECYS